MSYLEYSVKSVPTGIRKLLFLNWPLALLLTSVASMGFLMLYSVAGGSFQPWAEPQMKRFALGMAVMVVVGMIPIWFWRNIAGVGYLGSLVLLLAVEFFGTVGMGAQRWIMPKKAAARRFSPRGSRSYCSWGSRLFQVRWVLTVF